MRARAELHPWIGQHAAAAGYEICCHGWRWESHAGMAPDAERALIARAVATIQRVHGKAPVGWHTKSSPSVHTRRLLVEHGGFLYDSDAYNDDAPYYVEVVGRPHLVVPYGFDTNDMRFFDPFTFVRASDFSDYVIDSFDWLWREGAHRPRLLSIGLHTRIIGRPAASRVCRPCSNTCERPARCGAHAARILRATGSRRCRRDEALPRRTSGSGHFLFWHFPHSSQTWPVFPCQ